MTLTDTVEVPRDARYGRPLIVPPKGGKPVAYQRVTTLAGMLEDMYALSNWQKRMVALGLAERPDLLLSVAAHRKDKEQLDRICEDATEAAKAHAAATIGTALHALVEQMDRGYDLGPVPSEYAADLSAYTEATKELTNLHVEQMTVLDDIKVAGTPDRVVEYKGERYIADIKTGSIEYGMGKIALQLALYSRGVIYNHPGIRGENLAETVNQNNALVIWLPAGTGTCSLHWVNIKAGWQGVELALQVREWRKRRDLSVAL